METGEPSPCLQNRTKGFKLMKRKYKIIGMVCGFVLLLRLLFLESHNRTGYR